MMSGLTSCITICFNKYVDSCQCVPLPHALMVALKLTTSTVFFEKSRLMASSQRLSLAYAEIFWFNAINAMVEAGFPRRCRWFAVFWPSGATSTAATSLRSFRVSVREVPVQTSKHRKRRKRVTRALSVPWASRFAAKESFACARYLETKDIVMSPRSLMNQGTYVSENRLYHWNSLNFYWGKWWATNINIWGIPFSDYTIWSCLWSLSHFAESSAYTISQLLLIPVVMTTDPQGLSEHLILSGIVHPQKRANTYIIFHWHCHFQRVTTYLEGF